MYFYGLGEFFYTNGIEIDEENFMKITVSFCENDKYFHRIPLCKVEEGDSNYIKYNPKLKDKDNNELAEYLGTDKLENIKEEGTKIKMKKKEAK